MIHLPVFAYPPLSSLNMRMDKRFIWLFLITGFLHSCTSLEKPVKASGEIMMKPQTRGSFQYLIKTEKELFWPENLPEDFHDPGLKVKFKYFKKDYSKDIYKPAPNDIPIKDFAVPAIYLLKIRKNK